MLGSIRLNLVFFIPDLIIDIRIKYSGNAKNKKTDKNRITDHDRRIVCLSLKNAAKEQDKAKNPRFMNKIEIIRAGNELPAFIPENTVRRRLEEASKLLIR
jgi:hypothetical protein